MSEDRDNYFMEPMRMWREWVQKSEKQWSEALTGMMADEKSSKMFGHYFQEWLHAQNMFTEMIGQQLATMNLPSRADVLGVEDRLSGVEDALSTLTAEIHQLKKQLAASGQQPAAAPAKPKRTRRPQTKTATKATGKSDQPTKADDK
ncbi:MAG: hypothetical protein DRR06_09635 [Gammaproteobacteria bacterium]|nr:MAG: hypothetical protein DRR06_09635 [Gammaproteobacteria bacterium]RLA51672.1 MAG: hypothetical protein DRR42_09695 [Gammaproteobacteria bacterium]